MEWSESDVAFLREAYSDRRSIREIAIALGRSQGAIRNKAYKLKITHTDDNWTPSEVGALTEAYKGAKTRGDLAAYISSTGRSKFAVSIKAGHLGLTCRYRKGIKKPKVDKRKYKTSEERWEAHSKRMKERHATKGHPMAGRKHTADALEKISEASRESQKGRSAEMKAQIARKAMETKMARYGTRVPNVKRGSWKAGWREIGGKRNYYRSRWEANYARYLEWLKVRGDIAEWQHEPETFWFEAIKRGVRSYLPDFRVWENDGSTNLHEVKGWMDARSKTTLKRMAKYHPQENVIVIREKGYNEIAKKVGPLIEGWEKSERSGRL